MTPLQAAASHTQIKGNREFRCVVSDRGKPKTLDDEPIIARPGEKCKPIFPPGAAMDCASVAQADHSLLPDIRMLSTKVFWAKA